MNHRRSPHKEQDKNTIESGILKSSGDTGNAVGRERINPPGADYTEQNGIG